MKWKSVLAIMLMAALILPVAGASSDNSSIGGELVLSPSEANASIVVRIPAPENLTSLEGSGRFVLGNGSFAANLSLSGAATGLEGLTGSINASAKGTAAYDPETESLFRSTTTNVSASLEASSSESPVKLSFGSTEYVRASYNLATEAGVSEKRYILHLLVKAWNETTGNITVNLSLHGDELSVTTPEKVHGEGSASGNLQLVMGEENSIVLNISLSYSYTVNLSEDTANITADAYIDAGNPMVAYQVYLALVGLVNEVDIGDYVTVEPPSYSNPTTVTVHVAYSGDLDLEFDDMPPVLPGLPLSGVSPEDLASPAVLLPNVGQNITVSYETEAAISVLNGTFTLEAASSGTVENASCNASATATLSVWLDQNERDIVVEINFSAENLPDTLSLFYLAKTALAGILENATSTLRLVASGGLELYEEGSPASTVNLTEDVLDSLAVKAGDLLYYSPSSAYALGPNITLPALIQKVVANGTDRVLARLPYPSAKVLGSLSIEFPDRANVTILGLSEISGTLVVGVEGASADLIPSNISAVPAGPAVVVRNVTGYLRLEISVNSSASNLALLVIHDNGSISLITNVSVEDDYLIALVSAGSTYIPVSLTSGWTGGGETNTTTSKAGTTSTPTQTFTTTSPAESTIEKTTIATTSSTAPTSASTGSQAQTPPAGMAGGQQQESGVSAKTIAAAIIILIVVAAALAIAKR